MEAGNYCTAAVNQKLQFLPDHNQFATPGPVRASIKLRHRERGARVKPTALAYAPAWRGSPSRSWRTMPGQNRSSQVAVKSYPPCERGPGYVYELLYDGDGSRAPHLYGLLDAATLEADAVGIHIR
jgi:hypothetical protein